MKSLNTNLVKAADLKEGMIVLGYATQYDAETIIRHETGRWPVLSNRPCSVFDNDEFYPRWANATFIRWAINGEYTGVATYADLGDLYIVEAA